MIPTSDLTKEKTLWQIYKAARVIRESPFNKWSSLAVFLGLGADSLLSGPAGVEFARTRELATLGFTTALAVLAFLIAGFTIFVTVCRPGLLVRMAVLRHPETELSWFKYNFFTFMRVFAYYIVFAFFCLVVILFGEPGGILSRLVQYSPEHAVVKIYLARLGFVILGTTTYFALVQLKSFVFNVYHVTATWIRWEAENPREECSVVASIKSQSAGVPS